MNFEDYFVEVSSRVEVSRTTVEVQATNTSLERVINVPTNQTQGGYMTKAATQEDPFCRVTLDSLGADGIEKSEVNFGGFGELSNDNTLGPDTDTDTVVEPAGLPELLFAGYTIEQDTFSAAREKIVFSPGCFVRNPSSLYYSWNDGEQSQKRFSAEQAVEAFKNGQDTSNLDLFRISIGKYWYHKDNKREEIWSPNAVNDPTRTGAHNDPPSMSPNSYYNPIRQERGELFRVNPQNSCLLHYEYLYPINGSLPDPEDIPSGIRKSYTMIYYFGKNSSYTTNHVQNLTSVGINVDSIRHGNIPIIEFKNKYLDFVHETPLPFYRKETNNLTYGKYHKIEVNVVSNYVNEQSFLNEPSIRNIYEVYQDFLNREESIRTHDPMNGCDTRNFKYKIFTPKNVKQFKNAEEKIKNLYPHYVQFDLYTSQASKFTEFIESTRMGKYLLELIATQDPRYMREINCVEAIDELKLSKAGLEIEPTGLNDRVLNVDSKLEVYDVIKYLKDLNREKMLGLNLDYFPLKLEGEDNLLLNSFWDLINKSIFTAKLKKDILPDRFRSLEQILKGEKAYSETVAYKIEKHIVFDDETVDPEPIQCFILSDSEAVEKMTFLDSQVTYDKTYYYRIFAINMVVATEYENRLNSRSVGVVQSVNAPEDFSVEATTRPKFVLCKVPYFEKVVKVKDKPPIFPSVTFLPYSGVDDEVGIMLEVNHGKYDLRPIIILDEDLDMLQQMRLHANSEEEGKIIFQSDSQPNFFQLFRLDYAPKSYRDFKDGIISNIRYPNNKRQKRSEFSLVPPEPLDKAFIGRGLISKSKLEPNKDYYYCFRSIDDAGFSIPTEVFKVKIVSYADGIYLDVQVYDMNKTPPEENLSFGRFLQISPALVQSVYKLYEEEDVDSGKDPRELYLSAPKEVALGTAVDPIWDKKYKLRIRSKQSGKMFDVNFKFIYNIRNITPPETRDLQDMRCFKKPDVDKMTQVNGYIRAQEAKNFLQPSTNSGYQENQALKLMGPSAPEGVYRK